MPQAPGAPYAELSRNPYVAGHHVLLAHASAVRAFRLHATASGATDALIGITNNIDWREPLTPSAADVAAVRCLRCLRCLPARCLRACLRVA